MSRNREILQRSLDRVTHCGPLRECVRTALHIQRPRLHAVVAAAAVASATPLALGAAFPPVLPLGSLYALGGGDGSSGFVLTGIAGGDESGRPVSAAGDINGDGIDDIIIGANQASSGGHPGAGESYVVFGSTQGFPAIMPLATVYPAGGGDGTRGFVLTGVDDGDASGYSVSAAGDVNGDGIDDIVIGAANADPDPHIRTGGGKSYVVFGSTQGFPAILPLVTLEPAGGGDGSRGFVLTGDVYDTSGFSVSAAGDVNGDGVDDLIIGAPGPDPAGNNAGESYVVFGSTAGFAAIFPLPSLKPAGGGDGSEGFVLAGAHRDDDSGRAVSGAGDVNGDGIDDLIIGVRDAPAGGEPDAGQSYVVFGSTQPFPAIFPLVSLYPPGDGSRGFVLTGIDEDDQSGDSVSAAGDVNADGVDDLIIGADTADPGGHAIAGESYVVFGSTQGFAPVVPLGSLFPPGGGDGSRGFVLTGIDTSDRSGISVRAAGDVNDDGIDDVIVGAMCAGPGGDGCAGESHVVFGSAQGFPAILPLGSLYPPGGGDGSRGFVLTGIDTNDLSGFSVSGAGDVNGDGIDDVIIGAPNGDPGGVSYAGESYVVFGRSDAP